MEYSEQTDTRIDDYDEFQIISYHLTGISGDPVADRAASNLVLRVYGEMEVDC